MLELKSADSFMVDKRRIWCFEGIEGLNPRSLIGQEVIVDGLRYVVRGADTFAIMDATGTNFGLALVPVGSEER